MTTDDKTTCPNGKPPETWTISQIADQLDISTRTIRFYEEKGLIQPKRTSGNQRVYTPRNKARLKLILRGKRFGFSLEEIAEMIGMANADPDERLQIEKSLKFGDAKLRELRDRKKELELLEQDILATRQKLVHRITQLDQQTQETPSVK
ncbi:MAG: MerR family DNA-binding transcriptional regulator [Proteobacteria bacterium]|nr:MerR family DNA-binding transcriptional regulator [Desulfobacula sp.]MBU3953793.1 MerR family DNA-binding transcriptional regulator [Pseudomonadota bacterium]MBU4129592.1 MerR family DNA-binding transcriptional regulator [Pseudomonadota bacterium]